MQPWLQRSNHRRRCCIASQPSAYNCDRCDVCCNVSARRAASSSGGPRRGLREACAEHAALCCANRLALPQLGMPRAMFVALAEAEAELEPICAHLCGSAAALFKRECAPALRRQLPLAAGPRRPVAHMSEARVVGTRAFPQRIR